MLIFADKSDTRCGLLLRQGSTSCAFSDALLQNISKQSGRSPLALGINKGIFPHRTAAFWVFSLFHTILCVN